MSTGSSDDPGAWILAEGRLLSSLSDVVDGICGRLESRGLELVRVLLEVRTLHPEVALEVLLWSPHGQEVHIGPTARVGDIDAQIMPYGIVRELGLAHGALGSFAFRSSPLFQINQGEAEVRCRIDPDATSFEYPVLADFKALGCTDYMVVGLAFIGGARSSLSFATRKQGGFSDADLELIRGIVAPISMCVDTHAANKVTRALLRTYLGVEPGERVLSGRIRRGDVEELEAAIWFSDLRGFTARSTAVGADQLIDWLNAYFGEIAAPIAEEGGEILKFIGDAVLAVFPVTAQRSRADACVAAIRAARRANRALAALQERRGEPFAHGIALHVGTVQYGNIGAERRLDFTVIGPEVNLASRVEGLCARLGHRTLATEAVARLVTEQLPDAGSFELKGVQERQRVYVVE